MRPTRRSVANALRAEARRDVPPPSAAFIHDLEQRLVDDASITPPATLTSANVLPFRRRISRGVAIGVVAAVISGAGAAAVAIVRESRNGSAAVETTLPHLVPETTTPAGPSSSAVATTSTTAAAAPTTARSEPEPVAISTVISVTAIGNVTTDPPAAEPAPEPAVPTTARQSHPPPLPRRPKCSTRPRWTCRALRRTGPSRAHGRRCRTAPTTWCSCAQRLRMHMVGC